MFQFTNTTIINSLDNEKIKVLNNGTTPVGFVVKRVGTYYNTAANKNSHITCVNKREGYNERFEQWEIKLTNTTEPYPVGQYQLALDIVLSNDGVDSRYARSAFQRQGRPFYFNFEIVDGKNTKADLIKAITDCVAFVQKRFGDIWFKVYAKEGTTDTVVVEAIDGFQHFKSVKLQTLQEVDPICGCDENCRCEYQDIDGVVIGTTDTEGNVKPNVIGRSGFGTFNEIIKDLRLPTADNTRWLAVNEEERPVLGGLYDEYIITYSSDRGTMGQSVVGGQATSVTNHVFFVLNTGTLTLENPTMKFATELAKVHTIDTVAGEKSR